MHEAGDQGLRKRSINRELLLSRRDSPGPEPRPLGNESTDPFSPTLPPGSLHEVLRQEDEDEISGAPTPVVDDPRNDPGPDNGKDPGK